MSENSVTKREYNKMRVRSVAESTFEWALGALAKDIPAPEAEYRFHPIRRWRVDFAWPKYLLAVEIDGTCFWNPKARGGRHNTDSDRCKMNCLQEMGWTVFRFSTLQIKDDVNGCVEIVNKFILRRLSNT